MKYFIIFLVLFSNNYLSAEWKQVEIGELGIVYNLEFADPNYAFLTNYRGKGIYKSTDNGDNWNLINLNLSNEPVSLTFYKNYGWLGISPLSGSINSEIMFTSNYGVNWEKINSFQGEIPIQMKAIDSNKLFLLAIKPNAYSIKYSIDRGLTWESIENGNSQVLGSFHYGNKFYWCGYSGNLKYFENGEIKAISSGILLEHNIYEVRFLNDNLGFVSCNKGKIFKTNNSGILWEDISNGIPSSFRINGLYFKDERNGWISGYDTIQNYSFVYSTIDGGLSWVEDLKFNNSKFYDFALSSNNKLWIRGNNSLLFYKDIETSIEKNNEFKDDLYVYPNPASDYIEISLPENMSSNPTLKHGVDVASLNVQIYNMLGLEVAQTPSFVNSVQSGASDLLIVDVSHLPAGVYHVRIIGSNGVWSIVEKFVKM